MTRPLRDYIVQIVPRVLLDDTPSGSSSSDEDESVHSSHRSPPPVVPQIPVPPRSPTPPPPAQSPIRYPAVPHDFVPLIRPGERRMRGQLRKTTGLPPRGPLAPRDPPSSTYERGGSSAQAELRAQLQQVSSDVKDTRGQLIGAHNRLNGAFDTIQQASATIEQNRIAHQALAEQVTALEAGSRAWQ